VAKLLSPRSTISRPGSQRRACKATCRVQLVSLFSVEHRTRHAADGTYHWFQSRAVPVHDEQGRITEWFGTSTDIDDQVRAREVLARGREELETLVAARTADLA